MPPRTKLPKLTLTGVSAIWGQSKSGKTYLAQRMVEAAKLPCVVVISPQSATGTDAPGVYAALHAGSSRIVCNSNDPEHMIGAVLIALDYSTPDTPVFVVADEAPAYLKQTTPGLSKAAFQGRHAFFGMLLIGQRPAAVAADIRSQAQVTYWMQMQDHRDLQTARESLGPQAANLPGFKQGQFFQWPQ